MEGRGHWTWTALKIIFTPGLNYRAFRTRGVGGGGTVIQTDPEEGGRE